MSNQQPQPSVLFAVPRFHPNIFVATRTLARAGYRVTVMAGDVGPAEDHSVVKPIVFGGDVGLAEITATIQEAAPDLVFLRSGAPKLLEVARAAKQVGAAAWTYSLQPATQPIKWKKRLRLRMKGLPVRRVTPVPGRDHDAVPDPNARFLPWPVEREGPVPKRKGSGPVTVVCVGKLIQPRKNLHLAVEALRTLGRKGLVRLVLVGASGGHPSGHSAEYLKSLEIAEAEEDWIDIQRDVPLPEMPKLYRQADICLLPSVGEPLGYAPVEAMAYGAVPVISIDAGSAGYLRDGENGMCVDVTEAGRLELVLGQVVTDHILRERLSVGAVATAEGELGPERFLERIDALLAEG